MKAPSLHVRLLLGASVAILAALAVAWLAMTWLFDRHVERREAAGLTRSGVLIAGLVRPQPGPLALESEPPDPRFQSPAGGLYWQASEGGQSLRSRSLWDQSLAATPAVADAWRTTTVDGPFGRRLLVVARRIQPSEGRAVLVQVATDAEPLAVARAEFARELAGFMAVLWVVLTAAAFAQVWLGLRPLVALRRDLARMKRSVTERLPNTYASELAPLVGAINALADSRQADIDRARRRAADLAHGLKTPLAAMAVQSRRARERGATEAADGMDRAIDMVAAALEAELARSRAAAVRDQGVVGACGPAAVAERLFAVLERTDDGARVIFDPDFEPDVEAPVSEGMMMELLGPLLENAARHARRRVRIRGRRQAENALRIDIEDDGPGLSPDRAETALMRGGRLDEAGPGHGLGLAIARDLVEATNGRIDLGAAELGGLRVSLIWDAG